MVINIVGLIFFVIWLIVGIVTAVMVAHGEQIPKMTFFCALLVVLVHYLEEAVGAI